MLVANHAMAASTRQGHRIGINRIIATPMQAMKRPASTTMRRSAGSGLSSVEYACDDTGKLGCRLLLLQ